MVAHELNERMLEAFYCTDFEIKPWIYKMIENNNVFIS